MSDLIHKAKVRMARRMLTNVERKMRVSIFQSSAWCKRRDLRTGTKQKPVTFSLEALSRRSPTKKAQLVKDSFVGKVVKSFNISKQPTV